MLDTLCTIEPTPDLESRDFRDVPYLPRRRYTFFSRVPQMERVSENDVDEDVVPDFVCNVNRRT